MAQLIAQVMAQVMAQIVCHFLIKSKKLLDLAAVHHKVTICHINLIPHTELRRHQRQSTILCHQKYTQNMVCHQNRTSFQSHLLFTVCI